MKVTLPFNKTSYYKTLLERFFDAIKAARTAFWQEINSHTIYKPIKESDFD